MNRELLNKIKYLCLNGLEVGGEHHKQWYLEQVLEVCGFDLFILRCEFPVGGEAWEWEPGIAP